MNEIPFISYYPRLNVRISNEEELLDFLDQIEFPASIKKYSILTKCFKNPI
ncbi:hypothetical protein DICPUDRAFT_146674 [Dictyostelium purpureum]|uniref:Uncharacterized protein n=1 Tax=Dictyostelium purpureum TaxID=5786 RepID=F0Z6K7_DICPU|nr:uncharacterized protein DICPUDRAFT_146674 [Dictyostelium purpureum]EGC40511.1 hypothetical protein DICPUDRAFT_146674 [Dictyostelium purpureum]|eukprot:XP_003283058.1 hypothetical protein DICPUDRAFT_146674 [Dictyostelium purpureum]